MKIAWGTGNLVVYKDLLIAFGKEKNTFLMATLNLESKCCLNFSLLTWKELGLSNQDSAEQKPLKTLFMSKNASDLVFKVEDKLIPAHKQVLTERSKYFANLFKSNMAESRQETIEIQDCEHPLFIGFVNS